MAAKDNYQLLVEKLDQFIRKYYVNQLIRGGLYSIGTILILFLAVSLMEHYFYFGTGARLFRFLAGIPGGLRHLGGAPAIGVLPIGQGDFARTGGPNYW